jgi:hypothetical protein
VNKRFRGVYFAASITTLIAASAFAGDDTSDRQTAPAAPLEDQVATSPMEEPLVTYTDHSIIPHGKCQYFRHKSEETVDPKWLERYKLCENG